MLGSRRLRIAGVPCRRGVDDRQLVGCRSTAVGWAHPGMTTVARIRVAAQRVVARKAMRAKSAAATAKVAHARPTAPTGPIRCALTSPAEPCRAPVDAASCTLRVHQTSRPTNVAFNKDRVQQIWENTLMTSTTRPSLLAIAGATASAAVLAVAHLAREMPSHTHYSTASGDAVGRPGLNNPPGDATGSGVGYPGLQPEHCIQ